MITVCHTFVSQRFRKCGVLHITDRNDARGDGLLPAPELMWRCVMPTTLWNELREVLWLVSVVGGLSTLGVMLAVAAAVTGSV
jgi:hypothetical protein